MAVDAHKNFAYSTIATAPSPADTGTSLVVAAGDGTKFPTVPFNVTIWPTGVQPLTSNAEIVRVTAIATDTFTITRAQEGSTARSIIVGDQIAATITAKTLTDAEDHNILSATHSDSLAASVVRGDLIIGNSTPVWSRLAGIANAVLQFTTGGDIAWTTAPKLANIADTAGTTRITTATASPQVRLDGDLVVYQKQMAVGSSAIGLSSSAGLYVVHGGGSSFGTAGVNIAAGLGTNPGANDVWGLGGLTNYAGDGAALIVAGLVFIAGYTGGIAAGSVTTLAGIKVGYYPKGYALVEGAGVVTTGYGILVDQPVGAVGRRRPTTSYGIYITNAVPIGGTGTITTACGLAIENITGSTVTNRYVLEAGGTLGTTPYFRIAGNFTAAANATPIYVSEGVTPTLRQMKTRVWDATAGHGFTNGDLVAILV